MDKEVFVAQNGYKDFTLHPTFDVRWSASHDRSIKVFNYNHKIFLLHMRHVITGPLGARKPELKRKCQIALRKATDRNFVSLVNFESDALGVSSNIDKIN